MNAQNLEALRRLVQDEGLLTVVLTNAQILDLVEHYQPSRDSASRAAQEYVRRGPDAIIEENLAADLSLHGAGGETVKESSLPDAERTPTEFMLRQEAELEEKMRSTDGPGVAERAAHHGIPVVPDYDEVDDLTGRRMATDDVPLEPTEGQHGQVAPGVADDRVVPSSVSSVPPDAPNQYEPEEVPVWQDGWEAGFEAARSSASIDLAEVETAMGEFCTVIANEYRNKPEWSLQAEVAYVAARRVWDNVHDAVFADNDGLSSRAREAEARALKEMLGGQQ